MTLTVTPSTAGTITNQATVGANEPDPNPGNNAASEPTTVEPPPSIKADLALTETDAPDPVTACQQLTYILTVRNDGPQSATGVTLIDDLPAGVTLGPVTPSQGSCGTDPVVCDLGTTDSGAQATGTSRSPPRRPERTPTKPRWVRTSPIPTRGITRLASRILSSIVTGITREPTFSMNGGDDRQGAAAVGSTIHYRTKQPTSCGPAPSGGVRHPGQLRGH